MLELESKHYKGEENHPNNKFTENRLRQSLKIYTGTQSVSNFRPTAKKLIYEKFGGEVVWDMSCGWGGRLLGFLSTSNTKHYIGTEPSTRTFDGLLEMKKDFRILGKKLIFINKEVRNSNQKKNHSIYVSLPHLISILKNISWKSHKVLLNSLQRMNG